MKNFATALLGAALLLTSAAFAQNSQDLPAAPTPVQPRFPGAPAQPPKAQPAPDAQPAAAQPTPAAQPDATSAGQPTLSTLPPAHPEVSTPAAPEPSASQQDSKPVSDPSELLPPMKAPSQSNGQQQPPSPAEDSGEFRIGVQVDLVNLIFTAVDKHGRFIKDLKQSDVKLLDNGKPPARVDAFESETGLPLRVGLLIDASNSIRDRFRFEQDAAVEFLNQVVRPKTDLAFVVGFDSTSDLTQDFTDNSDKLSKGVHVLRPGGGTALHDAVYEACEKLAKAPVKGPARRAIIILSDGDDNQSRHTREEAIEAALRAEVIIYTISTDVTDNNRRADKVLMRYAEATGGQMFTPLRLEDVSNAFADIQTELRSQYVIAYVPQNFEADGLYRTQALTAPTRQNIRLRARKGYYAPGAEKK